MSLVKSIRHPSRVGFPAFSSVPLLSAFDDVENRMRRFFDGDSSAFDGGLVTQTLGWIPPMEISEMAEELTLSAELPGMDRKDVDVSVDDGVLIVRGEKTEMRREGDDGRKLHLTERTYGSFQRAFTLPRSVDASKISADFAKGVLTVHMPKTNESKAKGRKVEISPGQ